MNMRVRNAVVQTMCAAGAGVLSFLLMSQAGTPASPGNWGPPKKGMVNVFHSQPVAIPAGGTHVVYTVLPDRWLTVTSVGIEANVVDDPNSIFYNKDVEFMSRATLWSEVTATAIEHKGYARNMTMTNFSGSTNYESPLITPSTAGGIVGWTFRPGSSVAITNTGANAITVSSYALLGYQTRD